MNSVNHWRKEIESKGYDAIAAELSSLGGNSVYAKKALAEYRETHAFQLDKERSEREERTLEMAREANRIAQDANQLSKVAIFFSVIAIVASAWVVIATKAG